MTTEEKLKHFLDVTTESTNAKNAKVLEDYTTALEKAFEEHKEESTRKAALQLKLSEDSFKKKQNAEIARAQLQIRERVSGLSEELKAKLFTEVRDKLERYMDTREYQDYLVAEIGRRRYRRDEVLIYIDPADSGKLNSLAAMTNTTVEVSKYGFGGGIRALIRSRNILIDQSFETKLKEAEEMFVFQI
ncbi:MAG: ATPase [Eisenbergiella sp.]